MRTRTIFTGWLLLVVLGLPCAALADGCPTCGNNTPRADSMCGPKCLAFVCDKLGIKADLDELANLSGKDKRGTTLLGLSNAAEKNGLKAIGVKLGIEDLAKTKTLAIAHLWGGHYVVVEPTPDGILVTDPSGILVEGGKVNQTVPLDTFTARYSGFALLIAKDESSIANIETSGPDIRFEEYAYDFGYLDYKAKAEQTIHFRNTGNAPLKITGIETSCTCIDARADTVVLLPGDQAELRLTADTEGKVGRQTEIVYIRSNDPISPTVQVGAVFVAKPEGVLAPHQLDFGTITVNQPAKLEASVLDPGDGSLKVESVESDSPFITAAVSPVIDVDEGKEYPDYRLRLDLLPGVPLGGFQGKLIVHTNHPRTPLVEISVIATIRGNIEVIPDVVFLGSLEQGQKTSNSFKILATGSEPVKIKKIVSPCDYISTRVSPKDEGHEYVVTVNLSKSAPLGNIEKELIIRTDDRYQPEVRIKVYAMVENSKR